MYIRSYKLVCQGQPKMDRFRIVTTQGLKFNQLMKNYNVKFQGFVEARDDHYDNERWEITTVWESKSDWEKAMQHPMRKMFWSRFEMEALKHEIDLTITDSLGETIKPLEI